MGRVLKEKPRYGLVLEQADDGTYRLLIDGEVTFSSKVSSAVEIEFDEAFTERSEGAREARRRELSAFQIQGMMAQTAQSKAAARNAGRSRGKGG